MQRNKDLRDQGHGSLIKLIITPPEKAARGVYAKSFSSSNPKVAAVDKKGRVTALKKGTATITVIRKDGKKATCKVTVTTSPKLTQNGKTVKSIKLKKGKSTKLRISGKAASVNNVYKSKSVAKISAKKSATVITVKAVKRGKTTLAVIVNGVKLLLKVTVR